MPFEVGKTYPTKDGKRSKKVVAILPDGRLIVEGVSQRDGSLFGELSYREADGEYAGSVKSWSLVNPDEPTDEERELIAKICEIFMFNMTARPTPQPEVVEKLLKVLRNEGR